MVLLSILTISIVLGIIIKVYTKLTCGICKCSRHLVGKVVIVTGGNAGIGYETAKDLAERGARVILACRNQARGTTARDNIVAATGNDDVHYRQLDLTSLASVRAFAEDINKNEKRLDVLVNNAGIYVSKNELTEDGLQEQMQANHYGPFLLTNLLLPLLKSSAPSRIVTVSSLAHKYAKMDFDYESLKKQNNDSTLTYHYVYCNSKLCNILMTVELDKQLKDTRVTANCVHPGNVATDLFSSILTDKWALILWPLLFFNKTPWEGAQTSIYLSVSPDVINISGRYFADCHEINPSEQAQDCNAAQLLWKFSEDMVNLK